jgi:hypothetical protein
MAHHFVILAIRDDLMR